MLCIVDQRIPISAENALLARGASVLKLPPHPHLPAPVASHPDMLLFFAPKCIFCTETYFQIAKKELLQIENAAQKPIRLISAALGNVYPNDVLFNVLPMGNRLFFLGTDAQKAWLRYTEYHPVYVKQGYTKCSSIPLGSNALITEDPSVAKAAEQMQLEVLRIDSHAVALKGYDTGFLGGAASFAPYGGCNSLFFCGDLEQHPNAVAIRTFCQSHGMEVFALSNERLTDIGTIFII